jgi:hypothetical protein
MRLMQLTMVTVVAASLAALAAPLEPTGQDKPNEQEEARPPAGKTPRTMTLIGCIARGGGSPTQLTIDDEYSGKFQLSGRRLGRYLGQRVELAGSPDTGRLRIRGGLLPNPNVAGQAGAIDPVRAAVASQPGGGSVGTGDADLPGFRVKSIRALGGVCESAGRSR